MGKTCAEPPACPRVFETERGTVVVQGYVLTDGAVPSHVTPPTGESLIEMPREVLLRFASELEKRPAANLSELVANFQRSAFRLETLPQYLVDAEAERFAAFRDGRPLPERSERTNQWLRRIAAMTQAGQRWYRVHILSQPLTDYLRYELLAYQENAAVGEEIRIADVGIHPELADLRTDFWLLDGDGDEAVVALMQYDRDGRYFGFWRADDVEVIERCRRERDRALAASVPLSDFLAAVGDIKRPRVSIP